MTAVETPAAPAPVGARGLVVLSILLAAALCAWQLDLHLNLPWPNQGGMRIASEFFAAAFSPALTYEDPSLPASTMPFGLLVLQATGNTVAFAAAAMSLSLILGLVFGFLASTAWWAEDQGSRGLRRSIYLCSRMIIVAMRSVHELLWAVLFLVAFGLTPLSGVIAIAIPYGGTLAKVFSEMLEETPRNTAFALRSAGASPLQVFSFGLLPAALPDMAAYAFYRFECALRSAAILGFFGLETLGYFIKLSFDELHYGEVWTYLYAMFALVIGMEAWSGALRRRFVA